MPTKTYTIKEQGQLCCTLNAWARCIYCGWLTCEACSEKYRGYCHMERSPQCHAVNAARGVGPP